MILVPVGCDHPLYRRGNINAKTFQVIQTRRRLSVRAKARIHDDPITPANVGNNTFPESRTKKGNLQFVGFRLGGWLAQDQGRKGMFPPLSWLAPPRQATTRAIFENESLRNEKVVRDLRAGSRSPNKTPRRVSPVRGLRA